MQGQVSKARAAPPLIIQLFSLEDKDRQHWVSKQPGLAPAGRRQSGPSLSGASEGGKGHGRRWESLL
jgi:hypothetical protein